MKLCDSGPIILPETVILPPTPSSQGLEVATNNNKLLLSTYAQALSHLLLPKPYYYFHCTEKRTGAQRHEVTCSRSHS